VAAKVGYTLIQYSGDWNRLGGDFNSPRSGGRSRRRLNNAAHEQQMRPMGGPGGDGDLYMVAGDVGHALGEFGRDWRRLGRAAWLGRAACLSRVLGSGFVNRGHCVRLASVRYSDAAERLQREGQGLVTFASVAAAYRADDDASALSRPATLLSPDAAAGIGIDDVQLPPVLGMGVVVFGLLTATPFLALHVPDCSWRMSTRTCSWF